MATLKFPPLKAEQVECRVGTVGSNGFSVLLYKNARTDMDILDEVVGPESWQNEFFDAGGKLFCRLSIKVGGEWISKSDCGVEGTVGEEKSQASDARKRAGFAWGIGRELYNAPFIWLNAQTTRDNNGHYRLNEYPRLAVTGFKSDGKNVLSLEITDMKTKAVVFRHGDALKKARKDARPEGQAPAPAAKAEAPIMTATFDDAKAPAPAPSPAPAATNAKPGVMTKEQFRERWNSNAQGGGITFDDIADCAKAWGVCSSPRVLPINMVTDLVLEAAGCSFPEPDPEKDTAPAIDDSLAIALDDLKKARSRAEIQAVHNQYKSVYGEYGSNRNEEYIKALYEQCKKYPKTVNTK